MIHPRVTFVTADYVATSRGVSVEAVYDATGEGFGDDSLLWVFDVASRVGLKRELRFWRKELENPAATRSLTISQVIEEILPKRSAVPGQYQGLRNWEVGFLLRVSRRTLLDLRDELAAENRAGAIYMPRTSLETFFRKRWCFADIAQPIQTKLI